MGFAIRQKLVGALEAIVFVHAVWPQHSSAVNSIPRIVSDLDFMDGLLLVLGDLGSDPIGPRLALSEEAHYPLEEAKERRCQRSPVHLA